MKVLDAKWKRLKWHSLALAGKPHGTGSNAEASCLGTNQEPVSGSPRSWT